MKRFLLDDAEDHISDGAVSSGAKLVPAGTTFIVVRGMILAHTFPVSVAQRVMSFNQDVKALVPNGGAEGNFVAHWLVGRAEELLRLVTDSTHGTKRIEQDELQSYPLALPSPPEQAAIAQILSTVDEAVTRTEGLVAKLRQTREGLLRDLFSCGVGEDGRLLTPRAPSSRCSRTIKEVADPAPGSTVIGPFGSNLVATDYRESGHPVVFVRDIRPDGFEWNSHVYVSDQKARQLGAHGVIADDVLVTKMGDPPGLACMYPRSMPAGIVTADVIRIRVHRKVALPQWLVLAINSPVFQAQIRANMGGVTRNKLTLREFRSLVVPSLDPNEQQRVVDAAHAIETRIATELRFGRKLAQMKRGLLNDLLNGVVRVGGLSG